MCRRRSRDMLVGWMSLPPSSSEMETGGGALRTTWSEPDGLAVQECPMADGWGRRLAAESFWVPGDPIELQDTR